MIQRIQSIYLLLSAILGTVCLSMPLGYFTAEGVREATLYNLWLRFAETADMQQAGTTSFGPWALFAILLVTTTITFMAIFLYKRRALQMRIASFSMVLLIGYYAYLAFYIWRTGLAYTPSITAAFPFVCLVLDYLAFRGILKDELLIKSLDRLR